MQKRSEVNKEAKSIFRTKLKRTAIVVLCLIFAYSAIYAADISTKRMLKSENEDRYALRVSITKNDMLRIDLAGTKHYTDISDIKQYINKFTDKTQGILLQLKIEYEDYLKGMKKGRDL